MKEKLKGKQHETVAETLTDLGITYNYLDQYDKSLDLLKRALKINEKCLDKNDHKMAINLINLGGAYAGIGDNIKFKEMSQRSYDIFFKNYGLNHQWTQDALFNLRMA